LIRDDQATLNKKRMEWTSLGVVGQFQNFNTYEYNRMELNELLYNLGLLPQIASIDCHFLTSEQLEELKPLALPGKKYVRYTPNRLGKVDYSCVAVECDLYVGMSIEEKVVIWREMYERREFLDKAWEIQRIQAIGDDIFQPSRSVSLDTGTLSLLETPASYKATDVLHLFGPDILIHCAKVDQEKLDEYAAKGYLKKSELKSFRKLVDVQERYILMTLQSEDEKRKYWDSKLRKFSTLSQLSTASGES
jgi:hypothetical protein